jgi:hypothetical protein
MSDDDLQLEEQAAWMEELAEQRDADTERYDDGA